MIKLENVTKVYNTGAIEFTALKKVDMHIKEGEFVAIMGSSGAGKTTLMNIVGCLDRPTKGNYYLASEEIRSFSEGELAKIRNKRIGFVFQTFNLMPRLDALRNIEMPLIYAGESRAARKDRALEALGLVDLVKWKDHFPNELSAGQGQRVAIARALINNPDIILADEPTGNLDTASGLNVMNLFTEIHKKGVTIILITHNPKIAEYAKRTIHIEDGKIVGEDA